MALFNKERAQFFFSKGPDILDGAKKKNIFKCRSSEIVGRECCSIKSSFAVIANAGFTNFKNHLKECIPDYEAIYAGREEGGDIRNHIVVDKTSQNIYGWIDWVITENLPFSFVEKPTTRKYARKDPISKYTLLKYMDQLGFEVEGKLSLLLPDRFGILFDGWDNGNSTNYCGIFVNWYDKERKAVRTYLLRLAPLIRCDDFGADSHIETIGVFLANVGKSWDNVAVVMGDNTETNLAIARRSGKPFLGCFSHRLNLGVKVFLRPYRVELELVNSLMVALSSKKNCGRLRAGGCKLRPVRQHEIRWSGTFRMVKQYLAIRPFLNVHPWNVLNAILVLLPSPVQDARLLNLYDDLKKFESISKGLQRADGTLYEARFALDWLSDKYPETKPKLSVEFADHQWRPFESAVVKVQSGQENVLTADERLSLLPFLVAEGIPAEPEEVPVDIGENFEALMKRARREIPIMVASKYINLAFVKADTCVVERLFSITRKVWREDRKSMTQAHMELVMFLKCNRDLWDSHLIFKCRTNPRRRVVPAAAVAADQAAPVADEVEDGGAALGELVAFLADLDAEGLG